MCDDPCSARKEKKTTINNMTEISRKKTERKQANQSEVEAKIEVEKREKYWKVETGTYHPLHLRPLRLSFASSQALAVAVVRYCQHSTSTEGKDGVKNEKGKEEEGTRLRRHT